ncbi:hypothetical protein C8F01DRAFT_1366873 [Mycena amicta]|nr:hypothetical protein C8F01DRAFT_1366873 [Mycena amicta]
MDIGLPIAVLMQWHLFSRRTQGHSFLRSTTAVPVSLDLATLPPSQHPLQVPAYATLWLQLHFNNDDATNTGPLAPLPCAEIIPNSLARWSDALGDGLAFWHLRRAANICRLVRLGSVRLNEPASTIGQNGNRGPAERTEWKLAPTDQGQMGISSAMPLGKAPNHTAHPYPPHPLPAAPHLPGQSTSEYASSPASASRVQKRRAANADGHSSPSRIEAPRKCVSEYDRVDSHRMADDAKLARSRG